MANVELLERVLTYIKDHPEDHRQKVWAEMSSCGTAMCFAGWAVALSGSRFLWDNAPAAFSHQAHYCTVPEESPMAIEPGDHWVYREIEDFDIELGEGERIAYISDTAMHLLDLTFKQANELFDSDNTLEEIEEIVKDIINEQEAA